MNMNDVNKPVDDLCYYCDEKGLYWDMSGANIITVCRQHATNFYSS